MKQVSTFNNKIMKKATIKEIYRHEDHLYIVPQYAFKIGEEMSEELATDLVNDKEKLINGYTAPNETEIKCYFTINNEGKIGRAHV